VPQTLLHQLNNAVATFNTDLASPHATWKKLLQKKVSKPDPLACSQDNA
jgi:hypothetical protein